MNISFYAAKHKPRSQQALAELKGLYGHCDPESADTICVLGGDGTMLHALHEFADYQAPIYGMNLGTLGFLLNKYERKDLPARIEAATRFTIHPLHMEAIGKDGKTYKEVAFNEVSLLRETHNSAKLKIFVNDKLRLDHLVCDGLLVSTSVGSTAYNSSAGGPILPLDANILPITPISAFRPRRWQGALIHNDATIRIEVLKPVERPVSATADSKEVRDIREVTIYEAKDVTKTILFDEDNQLTDRIFKEQFADYAV
ncbi:MAG: NAD kinase [Bdellovibrionales bacterium]